MPDHSALLAFAALQLAARLPALGSLKPVGPEYSLHQGCLSAAMAAVQPLDLAVEVEAEEAA